MVEGADRPTDPAHAHPLSTPSMTTTEWVVGRAVGRVGGLEALGQSRRPQLGCELAGWVANGSREGRRRLLCEASIDPGRHRAAAAYPAE